MVQQATSKRFQLRQLCLAVCLSIGYFSMGLQKGFTSPGIPSMQDIDPHLVPNDSTISWIVSMTSFGGVFSGLVSGPLIHWAGRKRTLLMIGPLYTLAWIGIGFSNAAWMVIFFRAVAGFLGTACIPTAQIYVSECCDPEIRGILGSILPLSLGAGMLAQFTFGIWLDWRQISYLSAVYPAAMVLILIPFPESPAWLKITRRPGDAESAAFYGISMADREKPSDQKITLEFVRGAFTKSTMAPFGVVVFSFFFAQFCGSDAVISFNATIFKQSGSKLEDKYAALVFMCVHVVSIAMSFFFVDKYGRKELLYTSSIGMCLSMVALGTCFHLVKTGQSDYLGYIPLVSLMVYIASYSAGYATIPFLLIGEILPLKYRSICSPTAFSIGLIFMVLEIQAFTHINSSFGKAYSFWFFAAINFVSLFFVYFCVPETKGKSLDEIEDSFKEKTQN